MKLFTKSIDAKLFQQYNFGNDLSKQKVVAKIFNPYGRGVWYLLNSDPNDPDYIWAIVDLFEVEIGSVSRHELETMRIPPYNFNLERDLSFEPINANVLYKGVMSGKRYEHGGAIDVVKGTDERFALYPENSSADTMGVVLKKGGKIDDENQDMLDSIATEIQHHSKELLTILKKSPKVEAWVIAKAERCATDLSDITHFLEGKTTKFEYGGSTMNGKDLFTKTFAKGGKTYQKLDEISASVVNDAPTLEKLKKKTKDVGFYEIQEVELVKVGQKEVLNEKISSSADAVDIFRKFFNTEGIKIYEAMFVMLLNKANKVIAIYDHSKGSIDGTVADPLLMTATAIKALAKGVIIAHNHPSGNLTPSPADINMSNKLKNGLSLFDIKLLDSLIITENSYYSLAEEGKI
jgi:DNA repair protein RadC